MSEQPLSAPTDQTGGQSALPSLIRRFGALMVDWILCVLIGGLFDNPRLNPIPPMVVFICAYGFFLGFIGQTPGMWLTRIRCVSVADGRPIGVPRALLRGLLVYLLIPALIMDRNRRGLQDRAAGSIVRQA